MNELSPPTTIIHEMHEQYLTAREKLIKGINLIFEAQELMPNSLSFRPHHFYPSSKKDKSTQNEMIRQLDRLFWMQLMKRSQFNKILTREQLDKFHESIDTSTTNQDNKLHSFDVDVALNTFAELLKNRQSNFEKAIVTTFQHLSGNYKSHDAFKIKKRTIIKSAIKSNGCMQQLIDFDKLWVSLTGQDILSVQDSDLPINQARKGFDFIDIKTDGYEYKFFDNGNCHLIIHDESMLEKINSIIANHYGNTLQNRA